MIRPLWQNSTPQEMLAINAPRTEWSDGERHRASPLDDSASDRVRSRNEKRITRTGSVTGERVPYGGACNLKGNVQRRAMWSRWTLSSLTLPWNARSCLPLTRIPPVVSQKKRLLTKNLSKVKNPEKRLLPGVQKHKSIRLIVQIPHRMKSHKAVSGYEIMPPGSYTTTPDFSASQLS